MEDPQQVQRREHSSLAIRLGVDEAQLIGIVEQRLAAPMLINSIISYPL
jgi:hypothetical protein